MSAGGGERDRAGAALRLVHAAAALALAFLGLTTFHGGLQERVAAEPPALVVGAGLLPGADGPGDAEIRTPGLLARPAPHLRATGAPARRLGTALMAAALGLAALARPRGTRLGLGLRVLWAVPGAAAVAWAASRASGAAPSASHALEAFGAAAPAYGLSLLLVLAWRA